MQSRCHILECIHYSLSCTNYVRQTITSSKLKVKMEYGYACSYNVYTRTINIHRSLCTFSAANIVLNRHSIAATISMIFKLTHFNLVA